MQSEDSRDQSTLWLCFCPSSLAPPQLRPLSPLTKIPVTLLQSNHTAQTHTSHRQTLQWLPITTRTPDSTTQLIRPLLIWPRPVFFSFSLIPLPHHISYSSQSEYLQIPWMYHIHSCLWLFAHAVSLTYGSISSLLHFPWPKLSGISLRPFPLGKLSLTPWVCTRYSYQGLPKLPVPNS